MQLWDISDGQQLKALEGHGNLVTSVSFSPDGKQLASGSSDTIVRLWSIPDGELLKTLQEHTGVVWSVSFSPNGLILASGSSDQTVRLWRVSDGQLLGTFEGHTQAVTSISFSPNGKLLASGSCTDKIYFRCGAGEIRLWRVFDGQLLKTLKEHVGGVTSVSFSPDGQWVISGSEDGTIRLWGVVE